MNLQKAILELTRKGGLASEAESLKIIAENPALAEIELPEDVNSALTSLMGFDQAKNNYKVKNFFYAQALDAIDNQILTSAKEAGLTEDQITQLESEKGTGKRQAMLTQFLKDAKPAPSAEAAQKLKEAQERITALQAEKEQAVKEVKDQWNKEKQNAYYDTIANDPENPWPDHYNPKVRKTLLKEGEAELLQKMGGVLVYNEQTGVMEPRNANDPTLALTGQDQQPLTHKQIIEMVRRDNGYLKTDAGSGNTAQGTTVKTHQGATADTKQKSNPALSENLKILKEQGVEV